MKRAPTGKRLAILLDRKGNVAGLANDRHTYAAVEIFDESALESSPTGFSIDDPEDLIDDLAEAGVTDVVALYYEDVIYGALHGEGLTMWLAPPDITRDEAIREWHENTLTVAEAGVMMRRKGHLLHTVPIESHG